MTTADKLAEAIKLAEDAMAYVPEYFANKHGMLRRMAALKEVAAHEQAQADDWQHLKPYGYAPGNYMNTCLRCGEVAHNVDKRAHVCRPCAEARHAWEQPPCQQCGAMTADEAATKCLGAAAGDDCHGNHLWPT